MLSSKELDDSFVSWNFHETVQVFWTKIPEEFTNQFSRLSKVVEPSQLEEARRLTPDDEESKDITTCF